MGGAVRRVKKLEATEMPEHDDREGAFLLAAVHRAVFASGAIPPRLDCSAVVVAHITKPGEMHMSMTLARPVKKAGRVVVGPRQVQKGYARIVACEDGSGRIELYDPATRLWVDGANECTFSELWSAPPVSEALSNDSWLKVAGQGGRNAAVPDAELRSARTTE